MNPEEVKAAIYQKFESGGTTLREGFNQALKNMRKFANSAKGYENRIVMLTDVNDNSVENENKLIGEICESDKIFTTIIGVSTDFKSQTC